jgi:hypothetical protein
MVSTPPKAWTRDQVTAVLSLYCQIPFGTMHSKNPRIVALAKSLDRTPASVALKLVNLASLDPVHRERGVTGMKNASKLDRDIWEEFYGKWDALADTPASDEPPLRQSVIPPFKQPRTPMTGTTEFEGTRLLRRGQQFFRNSVLAAYEQKCCISGISAPELLRASHIIPWSASHETRMDPCNGLCLNALHDAAFDRGLITVDPDMRLVISSNLSGAVPRPVYRDFFGQYTGCVIVIPERFPPKPEYLSYHRLHVFRSQ